MKFKNTLKVLFIFLLALTLNLCLTLPNNYVCAEDVNQEEEFTEISSWSQFYSEVSKETNIAATKTITGKYKLVDNIFVNEKIIQNSHVFNHVFVI